eukprot:gene16922-23190_t
MHRVLVTGGNKGIGLAICTKLLDDHPSCHVLMGSRDLPRGQQAVKSLVESKSRRAGRVEVLQIDVSNKESVVQAAARVKNKFAAEPAPLYGIINNAGVASGSLKEILERTCEAFIPMLDPSKGRIVNIASASGPNFVVKCSEERQKFFLNPDITWEQIEGVMKEALSVPEDSGEGLMNEALAILEDAGEEAWAVLGWIETDLTKAMAAAAGKTAADMGMKQPEDGAFAPVALMMGDGRGGYYGSDKLRSLLDCYRSPGYPPYEP